MKTFLALFVSSILSVQAFADVPVKNPAYASMAKVAAKAIYDLNWGPSTESQFEVIKERYSRDDLHLIGKYKVRVFNFDNGEKTDRGIDLDVSIFDNAVLEVKVDCRTCG